MAFLRSTRTQCVWPRTLDRLATLATWQETTRQALRAFLWSGLPLATVATFDRQQLPQLALARIPGVASRFHTVLGRFGLPPGALAAPTAPAPAPMDPAALTAVVASAGSATSGAEAQRATCFGTM